MKDQYFGDIGDYGKYGLLRFLAKKGIKIGVHWYLTPSDGSNDGKFTDYLFKEKNEKAAEQMKIFDSKLYEILGKLVSDEETRKTSVFEDKNIIPNAMYYNTILNKNTKRDEWHEKALEFFKDCDLVFMDPDNGLLGKQRKHKEKFCLPKEVYDFYKEGIDVVYYCSKGRRSNEAWEEYKTVMKQYLPDSEILVITYHKGTQRSYIFVLHPKSKEKYAGWLNAFLEKWKDLFTEEASKKKPEKENKTI